MSYAALTRQGGLCLPSIGCFSGWNGRSIAVIFSNIGSIHNYMGAESGEEAVDPRPILFVTVNTRRVRTLETSCCKYCHSPTGSLPELVNGVSTLVAGIRMESVAAVGGVTGIYLDQLMQMDTEVSPEFIGADVMWQYLGGQETPVRAS